MKWSELSFPHTLSPHPGSSNTTRSTPAVTMCCDELLLPWWLYYWWILRTGGSVWISGDHKTIEKQWAEFRWQRCFYWLVLGSSESLKWHVFMEVPSLHHLSHVVSPKLLYTSPGPVQPQRHWCLGPLQKQTKNHYSSDFTAISSP